MENLTEKIEGYRTMAKNYMTKNRLYFGLAETTNEEFEHICNLAGSLLLTRDGILEGGSFVRAIVDNDLNGAIGRADATAIKAIKGLVVLKNNCDRFNPNEN